ncbi:MAG: DUF2911 domain-containing protein [Cyclobacteriaceae bacterium]|nr:DUF2911 domain-containing protein [Cyclobacteriaceae bacterium]MCH8516445.1 DUF2911 domain-containing protein [Cyclobacteriaceae bacterium]
MKSANSFAKVGFLLFMMLTIITEAFAQSAVRPSESPLAISAFKNDDVYIKVTYSRPHLRGRSLFGDIIEYGSVWRTGANEATELTTATTIKLAENELAPGTYSIFSIPNKEEWTIIVNREVGLWGVYKYQESEDVFRINIPRKSTKKTYEAFTIEFEEESDELFLSLKWDIHQINIPVNYKVD